MSADEIRKLAEDCKDKANYYKNMTPCSDPEHDKWYRDAAKIESDKAAALLACAALRESLEDACKCMCLDCDVEAADGYTKCGYECRVKRWRETLEGGKK